ncbi:MAG: hypothetical protein K5985_12005 [Lachnospiraceae bacterium]|nr:hypothetical protein [Lachnospiraceae bacterium]
MAEEEISSSSPEDLAEEERADNPEEAQIEEVEGEEEPAEEVPEPEIHLKTKTIPALVMLLGGSVTAVSCFVRHFPVIMMLEGILISLVIFLIVGEIIKMLLDRIVIKPPEKEEQDEEKSDGEVIEKTAEGETGQ